MAEKVEKERLDVLLVQQNLAASRELAKAYIMAGNVYVDGMKEDKAGTKVPVTAQIEVKGSQMKYVSRGGYKLEKAIDAFGISPEEAVYFGDDQDDAESMEFCGIGVAVENAIPEVKAVADEVTSDNDEDGVARWIEAHLLKA